MVALTQERRLTHKCFDRSDQIRKRNIKEGYGWKSPDKTKSGDSDRSLLMRKMLVTQP